MITNVMERLIDFTRTSGGGYFGPDGLFRFTPASRNLLTYTQEFDNAAWTKSNATALPFDPATATLGAELVTNGDFSGGTTGWTLTATAPATATIAGGKLTLVSPAGEAANATQAVLTVGKWYKITGDVTVRSGTVKVYVGNTAILSATQAFSVYLQATIATLFLSRNGACDADFDNISVREVIGGLITAPDGTLTGDALVASAGTSAKSVTQVGGSSGVQQTFSVHAKAGASSFVQIWHGAAANIFADFNLATGVVGTVGAGATATITSVGAGWYRCTVTCTPGSTNQFRVAMVTSATATYAESWTATGTESLYLWGAQLEAASSASTYTRNVGGVYPPRFDYDPVTLAPRGLLIEEQRTNLLVRSEEFENAAWVKSNATVAANAVVSPDGTADADKLVEAAANAAHYVLQDIGSVIPDNTTFTAAIYMKAAGRSEARLEGRRKDGLFWSANFDLAAGTLTASSNVVGTPTIEPVGDGWFRISASATSSAGASTLTFAVMLRSGGALTYLGDGTSGIYIWGAQLEAGAFPTSYIPTQASQVTRAADVAEITGANFSRWYNQTSGTFLVEWRQGGSETVQIAASVNDDTANNIMSVLNDNSSAAGVTPGAAVTNGGVAQANLTGAAITAGSTNKTALAYALNDFAYSQNGAAALTDTSGTIPTVGRLDIGNRVSALFTNGHIRRIKYYPVRLSNAQIQALTA